jgi:hypothetical protein
MGAECTESIWLRKVQWDQNERRVWLRKVQWDQNVRRVWLRKVQWDQNVRYTCTRCKGFTKQYRAADGGQPAVIRVRKLNTRMLILFIVCIQRMANKINILISYSITQQF